MDQSCEGMPKYCIDMVLCIDVSKSMAPLMRTVKEQMIRLPNALIHRMQNLRKHISRFRVRILVFNNDVAGIEHAVQMTDFFTLPARQDEFRHLVNSIEADGSSKSEYGLEALAYAMASDWVRPTATTKCRHIIALWTDSAPSKEFSPKLRSRYDPQLPSTFEELTAWWGDEPEEPLAKMNYYTKRLLIFSPDAGVWRSISESWENVIPVHTVAGQGLSEQDFREIISILIEL